jgi:hypothetical protein
LADLALADERRSLPLPPIAGKPIAGKGRVDATKLDSWSQVEPGIIGQVSLLFCSDVNQD